MKKKNTPSWRRPRQWLVFDHSTGLAMRSYLFKPWYLYLSLGFLLIAAVLVGVYLQQQFVQKPVIEQLRFEQQKQTQNQAKVMELKAKIDLLQAQVQHLNQALTESQKEALTWQHQFEDYQAIIRKQRQTGLHLLNAHAHWEAANKLHYRALLMQVGKRHAASRGKIIFVARGDHQQQFTWQKSIPFKLDEPMFLRGDLTWTQDWSIQNLEIQVWVAQRQRSKAIIQLKEQTSEQSQ